MEATSDRRVTRPAENVAMMRLPKWIVLAFVVALPLVSCFRRSGPDVPNVPRNAEPPPTTAPTAARRHVTPPADAPIVESPTAPVPAEFPEAPKATWTTKVFPEGAKVVWPENEFRGHVTDARRMPVGGARVVLVSCWLPRQVVDDLSDIEVGQDVNYLCYPHQESEAMTDSNGAFTVTCRGDGDRSLHVLRDHREAAFVDEPKDGLIVRLPDSPPVAAVHVLRDEDGTPVLGARVSVAQCELGALRSWWGTDGSHSAATTDADGRCRVDGIAAGPARVWVDADGRSSWLQDPFEIEDGGASIEVRLSAGVAVEGCVVDDVTGAAISGAHLYDGATSDGAGRFRVEHADGDRIDAWTHDRWPWRTNDSLWGEAPIVVRDGATEPVVIRLRRPARVSVRCVDSSGVPIRDAVVALSAGGAVVSDADGRASIRGVQLVGAGELRMAFYVDGVASVERTLAPFTAGETQDLGDVVVERPPLVLMDCCAK